MRHGPHHEAQKSTSTMSFSVTVSSKVSLVSSTVAMFWLSPLLLRCAHGRTGGWLRVFLATLPARSAATGGRSGETQDLGQLGMVAHDVRALRLGLRVVVADARVPDGHHAHPQRAGDVGAADVTHVGGAGRINAAEPGERVLEDARIG